MSLLKSNNIFRSIKLSLFCSKVCGFVFFTVKSDASGNFFSETTVWDYVLLAIALILACCSVISVAREPFTSGSRSIVIDIALFLFSKFVTLNRISTVLLNFYHRREWFQIIDGFHWIDKKVTYSKVQWISM